MRIAQAALILMAGNLTSRLLGLVREQVIAGLYGAEAATDALTAAARVPLTLYDLLIGGIVTAALVPVFSQEAARDAAVLRRTAATILHLTLLVALVLLLPLELLAPQWMEPFVRGFAPETRALTVELVRWMLPALLFMVGAGVLAALHYAHERYFVPALALSTFNGGIIVGALALHRPLGPQAVALGLLAGAVAQFLLLTRIWRTLGYGLAIDLRLEPVRQIGRLALPVFAGLVVSTAGVVLDTHLASRTGEGGLAALRFATTLVQLPLGLIVTATGLATLPTLSRSANSGVPSAMAGGGRASPGALASSPADAGFAETLGLGLKMVALLIFPITAGLVALREPLVRLLFQHGVFDAGDTSRTALAFLAYAPGLPAAALDQLLINAFYARRDTVTPVVVGVTAVAIYLIVALLLIRPLGYVGLALANSAQWTSHAVLMAVLLHRRAGAAWAQGLARTLLTAAAGSALMGLVLWTGSRLTGFDEVQGVFPLLLGLTVAVLAGGLLYGALLASLRAPEAVLLLRVLRERLRRRP